MRLLRELSRRKLRTTLTILGITIGIWALVVFSSMANKINALVEGGSQYFAGKVLVTDALDIGVGIGIAPMNLDVADQIAASTAWPPQTRRSSCSTTRRAGGVRRAGDDHRSRGRRRRGARDIPARARCQGRC